MNDLKSLPEVQQAGIYKKLCESILRTYMLSEEEPSAESWKDIYSYISKATNATIRTNKKGLRVSIGGYCEMVPLNTDNSLYRDSISRTINILDDGTAEGNKRIKSIHGIINAMSLRMNSRAGAKKGQTHEIMGISSR